MRLTKEDKEFLRSLYEGEEYFPQIEEAMDNTTYELCDEDGKETIRTITREEAIELLGRENWISGIDRSAFHWTAMRQTKDGKNYIMFNSSKLFR